MPDGIDLKRIIDLDPETTVTDDDYTIVDSTTGGAKKFAIGQALGEIKDGLDAVTDQINATLITDTASGAIASFPDGADNVPVKSLTVDIEPVQSGSGDPSPTNVRPISGHTSAVVTRTEKNLLDANNVLENAYIDTGSTKIQSITGANTYWTKVKKNTQYTFSDDRGDRTLIAGFASQPVRGAVYNILYVNSATGQRNATFNSGECEYIAFYTNRNQDTKPNWIQLEVGTTATSYEPYTANTYTIDLDGTRYGGTLNVDTGVLTVDRAEKTVTSASDISRNSAKQYYISPSKMDGIRQPSAVETSVISDKFKSASGSADGIVFLNAGGATRFNTVKEYASTSELIADLVSIQFVYPLATPFEVQLTAQEVTTLLGQNNIWNDCGNTEVEYRADTKLYIQKVLNA